MREGYKGEELKMHDRKMHVQGHFYILCFDKNACEALRIPFQRYSVNSIASAAESQQCVDVPAVCH